MRIIKGEVQQKAVKYLERNDNVKYFDCGEVEFIGEEIIKKGNDGFRAFKVESNLFIFCKNNKIYTRTTLQGVINNW